MKVVEESENRLVLSNTPGGNRLTAFTVLGILGCATPLLLVGLSLLYPVVMNLLFKGEFEGLLLMGSLLPLAMGGAFLSFFRHNGKTGSQRYQQTIERGKSVLQETFDRSGNLLEEKTTKLTDQSRLVGRHRVVKVPTSRGSTSFDFYDSLVLSPGSEGVKIVGSSQQAKCLVSLLQLRRVLELPLEVEFLPDDFRPRSKEQGVSKEEQSYRQSADKSELTIDLKGGVRRVSDSLWTSLGLLVLVSVVCFAILTQGWDETTFAVGIVFGLLALFVLYAAVEESGSSSKVDIANGRILWMEGKKVALDAPLADLRELVIMKEGLYFIFRNKALSLLTGSEGREERVYLYRLVDTTCQASGLPTFAGAFGQR